MRAPTKEERIWNSEYNILVMDVNKAIYYKPNLDDYSSKKDIQRQLYEGTLRKGNGGYYSPEIGKALSSMFEELFPDVMIIKFWSFDGSQYTIRFAGKENRIQEITLSTEAIKEYMKPKEQSFWKEKDLVPPITR